MGYKSQCQGLQQTDGLTCPYNGRGQMEQFTITISMCLRSPISEQDDPKSFKAESYPLSGMAETDKALHSLFDLIEKIYVRTWYNKFSANQCVPRKLR